MPTAATFRTGYLDAALEDLPTVLERAKVHLANVDFSSPAAGPRWQPATIEGGSMATPRHTRVVRLTGREADEIYTLANMVLTNADQWPTLDMAALRRAANKIASAPHGPVNG